MLKIEEIKHAVAKVGKKYGIKNAYLFGSYARGEANEDTALIGLGSALACRLLFGADSFMIPTMGCILALLALLRGPIERAGGLT